MSDFNINSDCCELYDFSVYGCQPTGLNPGNLVVNYTSDLWEQMFGNGGSTATCSWWEAAESGWVNPFNTAEQNPRNCINFRKRCTPPDRISLTLPGDCCGRVCPSVLDQMDFLKRDPKVQTRTVQVLGPTQMCKGSVSPPVPLQDLWGNGGKVLHVTLSDPVAAPEDNFLYQVSKNGHSWTTLSVDYVTNPQSLLPILFDQSYTDCSSSCICLNNVDSLDSLDNLNAFWGSNAVNGEARNACPPNYCYIRIIAIQKVCVESITATYANGGGLCTSLPTCPAAFEYNDRVCRPLPARGCPGLPAPQVYGWHTTTPDRPVLQNTDATRNRQLLSIAKQIKKLHPGGASASEHTRNVRAVAGPPFNSRATNDGARGISLNTNGYACGLCQSNFNCACGEGCDRSGNPIPNANGCSVPAFCRRQSAIKHQTDDRMLNELVACAVAGCRVAGGQRPCISLATN